MTLPEAFNLQLRTVRGDGASRELGEIRGMQAPFAESNDGLLVPILVTGTGRVGSTWLVHVLGQHHDVVAYRPFHYEPRAVGFWVDATREVADAAVAAALLPPGGFPAPWWVGAQAPDYLDYSDPSVLGILGSHAPRAIAEAGRRVVDRMYREVARLEGKHPVAFVEKSVTPMDRARWNATIKCFPTVRELVLVRDPRDVALSIMSYRQRFPDAVIGPVDASARDLAHWAARAMLDQLDWVGDRDGRSLVVRYEDLVAKPEKTLASVLKGLDLATSPHDVTAMVEEATGSLLRSQQVHRTSPTPSASIGRWRHETDPARRIEVDAELAALLADLGY